MALFLRGSVLGAMVANIAPAPLMIGALAFPVWVGLVGAFVGASVLAGMVQPAVGLAFLAFVGGPSFVIALATRISDARSRAPLLNPVSRGVIVSAGMAALGVSFLFAFGIAHFGGYASFAAEISKGFAVYLKDVDEATKAGMIKQLIIFGPALMASSITLMYALNLLFAGRVAQRSGALLAEPEPIADQLVLPRWLAALCLAATGASFLGGATGAFASIVAAALGSAFALLGLAVAHVITRGLPLRAAILLFVYLTLPLVPVLPLLFLAIGGLLEPFRDMRAKARAALENSKSKGD
jgi:hypothetical protein